MPVVINFPQRIKPYPTAGESLGMGLEQVPGQLIKGTADVLSAYLSRQDRERQDAANMALLKQEQAGKMEQLELQDAQRAGQAAADMTLDTAKAKEVLMEKGRQEGINAEADYARKMAMAKARSGPADPYKEIAKIDGVLKRYSDMAGADPANAEHYRKAAGILEGRKQSLLSRIAGRGAAPGGFVPETAAERTQRQHAQALETKRLEGEYDVRKAQAGKAAEDPEEKADYERLKEIDKALAGYPEAKFKAGTNINTDVERVGPMSKEAEQALAKQREETLVRIQQRRLQKQNAAPAAAPAPSAPAGGGWWGGAERKRKTPLGPMTDEQIRAEGIDPESFPLEG